MNERPEPPGAASIPRNTFRSSLVVAAVVLIALLVWQLANVLLLIFAAILFAIILRSFAGLIDRLSGLGKPWPLVLAVLLFVLVAALFFFLLGSQIQSQISSLVSQLPQQISTLGDRLGIENLDQRLAARAEQFSRNGLLEKVIGYTSSLLGALTSLLLVIAAGLYLARHPERYRKGFLDLVPKRFTQEAESTLSTIGHALQLWLLGQLFAMFVVGLLVTAGLFAIGMPSALALGFLAGVGEFVPIVGPLLSFIPALMLAFSEGGSMVYWVIGLYALVQVLESYLIMPLVQRKAVELPPVVTLFAIVAFGVLFGIPGILLGTPITVALFVAVKRLYVCNTLGKETEVPGDRK